MVKILMLPIDLLGWKVRCTHLTLFALVSWKGRKIMSSVMALTVTQPSVFYLKKKKKTNLEVELCS